MCPVLSYLAAPHGSVPLMVEWGCLRYKAALAALAALAGLRSTCCPERTIVEIWRSSVPPLQGPWAEASPWYCLWYPLGDSLIDLLSVSFLSERHYGQRIQEESKCWNHHNLSTRSEQRYIFFRKFKWAKRTLTSLWNLPPWEPLS